MSTLALCIPAYNADWCISRLLDSAKRQAIPFDEILVYDDCSTDNTASIARKYDVRVIYGNINLGCSTGKNKLAQFAESEWLHFHDSDDDILPNFTQVAHRCMKSANSIDIILLHFKHIDFSSGKILGEPAYNSKKLTADPIRFSIENKIVNFALIRKEPFLQIKGFDTDPAVLYNEDRAFYTKAAIQGLKFAYEPELTCINYFYPNSMSASSIRKCAEASINVWMKVIASVGERYADAIAVQLLQNATYAAVGNAWMVVRKSVMLAKKISPNQRPDGSKVFLLLYKINGLLAYYIREILLKYLTNKRK